MEFQEFYTSTQQAAKVLSKHKLFVCLPSQNYGHIAGKHFANILFHKYTHADKAIPILKEMGYEVSTRQQNIFNAYYKYFLTIK